MTSLTTGASDGKTRSLKVSGKVSVTGTFFNGRGTAAQ